MSIHKTIQGVKYMDIKGTKTEKNIIEAFINETQSALIYDYAAYRADVEGHNEIITKLRSSAAIRRGHAIGNMQLLQKNPLTDLSTNITRLNLQSAIATATRLYHDVYPKMAEIAREENLDDIANWFETLAKAERMEAKLYEEALKTLLD